MKRILIPTDHSMIADNAIEYALALPKEVVQEVLLFHAGAHIEENFIKLNKQVNRLSEKFKTSVINSEKPFSSDILKEIIKERHIDFIVIGTSGEAGSIAKKIFGSNTTSIIDDLICPAIVVPQDFKNKGITKIGYASDFSDVENEASQVIFFAKLFNAQIEILHVEPVYLDIYDSEKVDIENVIETIRKKHDFPNIQYAIEITASHDEIRAGIDHFIENNNPDLLVMFHQNRAGIDKLLIPSTTAHSITHLKLPLLVIPKNN